MDWTRRGTAYVFGDDIFGDKAYQHSSEKSTMTDMVALSKFCMVGYDPDFPNKAQPDDFVVAGKNFGCGHFHTQFLWSLQGKGVHLIAESVGRSFYRSAINRGYPFLECEDITRKVSTGDKLEVNFLSGEIKNLTTGQLLQARPVPEVIRPIIEKGGLIPYLREKLDAAAAGGEA